MVLVFVAMVGMACLAGLFVFRTNPSHPVAYDLEKSRRNLLRHRPGGESGRNE
jgi:hypothetical protein